MAYKAYFWEFENKKLMKILKTKNKNENRSKKLNLLNKKDNSLSLFSLLKVKITCNFIFNKKVEKE